MTTQILQTAENGAGSIIRHASRNLAQGLAAKISLLVPSQRLVIPSSVNSTAERLRKGNPDRGYDIYRGRFDLAGETINAGAKLPYSCKASDAWHAELHRFSWLPDLAAAGSELQRAQARVLLTDWIDNRETHHPEAMELGVVARRLLNLLLHSGFMIEHASQRFEEQFYTSLSRHVRWLQKRVPFASSSFAKLEAATALAYASVCLDTGVRFRDTALQGLSREVDLQISPDGCHVSRNPEVLTEILLDLLPLVELMDRLRLEPQPRICAAIDRALPALRMLCHGDSGLAAFNGMSRAMRGPVKSILERDEIGGKPVSFAMQTGYARLSHLRTSVIVDCGTPPSPAFAQKAHSGTLGFELSEGKQRIIVSCGESPAAPETWGDVMRTTAAHSTAVIGERASARLLGSALLTKLLGGPLMMGPGTVDCQVDRHDAGTIFSGRHDGYLKPFGLVHERVLWLSPDGLNLRGEDGFVEDGGRQRQTGEPEFALHFHLHPSVKATLSKDRTSAVLLLPDRSGWRFSAKGARLALEDSVYLVDRPTPQKTTQIVLSGLASGGHSVKWAFRKLEKQVRPAGTADRAPELPL